MNILAPHNGRGKYILALLGHAPFPLFLFRVRAGIRRLCAGVVYARTAVGGRELHLVITLVAHLDLPPTAMAIEPVTMPITKRPSRTALLRFAPYPNYLSRRDQVVGADRLSAAHSVIERKRGLTRYRLLGKSKCQRSLTY